MRTERSILFIATVFILFAAGSCTPFYLSSNFDATTAEHRIIAIAPIEMYFSGVIPKGWTEEDVLNIEEAESQAFQISFYNEILQSTKRGKKPLRVDVQHYKKTLERLRDQDISIRDSWNLKPEELARLLEVDAVVQARIEKTRFMSDLESYGIEVATTVMNILTHYRFFPWIPFSSQNKEINAVYSLVNGQDGTTLWSIDFRQGADWRQPANQIIDDISRKAAKKFPYRVKK